MGSKVASCALSFLSLVGLAAGVIVALYTPACPYISLRYSPSASVVTAAAASDPVKYMIPSSQGGQIFRRRVEAAPGDFFAPLSALYRQSEKPLVRAGVAAAVSLLLAGRGQDELPEFRQLLELTRKDNSELVRLWGAQGP